MAPPGEELPARSAARCAGRSPGLVLHLLLGPGGKLLAPWSAVRGVHLAGRVVHHRCQGRSDRLLLVSSPRAQSSLSTSTTTRVATTELHPLCGTPGLLRPPAWMSSSARAPSHSNSRRPPHFFRAVKRAKKPLTQPHHAKLRMELPNQNQGENLEDLHQQEMSTICSTVRCNEPCLDGKTLKTSMITTSAKNWNVHVLFGRLLLLLQRGRRHDSRHFHQLFCLLRTTAVHKNAAGFRLERSWALRFPVRGVAVSSFFTNSNLRHRDVEDQYPLLRPHLNERCRPPGWEEGGRESSGPWRSSTRSPPPWPWQSSDLVRCGATSLPGPSRRLAVHGARTGVTFALAAFKRRQARCRPP